VNFKPTFERLAVALVALLLVSASSGVADDNLLRNGEFTQGTLNSPADWRAESLRRNPETFSWNHSPTAPGELQINSTAADFAQWSQKLRLGPGWYRLSGELRTDAVGPGQGNITIGIGVSGATVGVPTERRGLAPWSAGSLYFKVGAPLEIRVICLSAGSSGVAHFRQLRLVATQPPPPGVSQVNLEDMLRQREHRARETGTKPFAHPRGRRWTVPVAMGVLITITLCGWLGFKRDQPD
jgi:hypothetical protein